MQRSEDDVSSDKEKVEKELKTFPDEAKALEEEHQKTQGTEFRYVCLFGFVRKHFSVLCVCSHEENLSDMLLLFRRQQRLYLRFQLLCLLLWIN